MREEAGAVALVLTVAAHAVLCLPVALVGLLQNLRDRREARLLDLVAPYTWPLRGYVSVEVRCRLLSRSGRVILHMWLCSPEQRWRTLLDLTAALPAGVVVSAEGPPPPRATGVFRMTTCLRRAGRRTTWRRPRPTRRAPGPGVAARLRPSHDEIIGRPASRGTALQ